MDGLNALLIRELIRRYEELAARVRELAAALNEEEFWKKPFAFGNSFGHLLLHVTGNLNYYIGAEIAATGYQRDRPREFTERAKPAKQEILAKFDDAIGRVAQTIRAQSRDDWALAYTAKGEEDAGTRITIVLRCLTHLDHHVGQMQYLAFALRE